MKSVFTYTKKRLHTLRKFLREYEARPDLDILHQIRVEIKKTKAVLNLIGYARKKFDAHAVYIPFRTIHRASGILWEPEVINRLMKKYSFAEVPGNKNEMETFRQLIPDFQHSLKKQKSVVLSAAKKVQLKVYKKYMKKKQVGLRKLIRAGVRVGTVHPIRKQLKELHYLFTLTRPKRKIDLIYTQCEKRIGQLLDQRLLIAQLRTQSANQKIISPIQAHMKQELNKIRKELRGFIKS